MSPVTKTVELEVAKRFCDLHFFFVRTATFVQRGVPKRGEGEEDEAIVVVAAFLKGGRGRGKENGENSDVRMSVKFTL